jgi:hypothetical protein
MDPGEFAVLFAVLASIALVGVVVSWCTAKGRIEHVQEMGYRVETRTHFSPPGVEPKWYPPTPAAEPDPLVPDFEAWDAEMRKWEAGHRGRRMTDPVITIQDECEPYSPGFIPDSIADMKRRVRGG